MNLRKITRSIIVTLGLAALAVLLWEAALRPTVVSLIPEHTVVATSTPDVATDYELYVASQEVQETLQLMFKKHQRDVLDAEILELSKR